MRVALWLRRLLSVPSNAWNPRPAVRQNFVPLELFYWNPETQQVIFRPDPDLLSLSTPQRAQVVYLAKRILEEYWVSVPKPPPTQEPDDPDGSSKSTAELIPFGAARKRGR